MLIAFRAAEEYVCVLRGRHKIVNAAIRDLIILPLGRRSLFSKCHLFLAQAYKLYHLRP